MTASTDVVSELPQGAPIHLLGIGGAGMSAIAWVLLGLGYRVSGSDMRSSDLTAALAKAGATIFSGHAAENLRAARLLVVSSAVPADNPEWVAAREAGIPVLDFLVDIEAKPSKGQARRMIEQDKSFSINTSAIWLHTNFGMRKNLWIG